MSDQPKAKRTQAEVCDDMTPADKKKLFDEIYRDEQSFDADNEIFLKKTKELNIFQKLKYEEYYKNLMAIELMKLEEIDNEIKRIAMEENVARSKIFRKVGDLIDKALLTFICNNLGPLLYDLADENFDEEKKKAIKKIIKESTARNVKAGDDLMKVLKLELFYDNNVLIPVDSNRFPVKPSAMTGSVQKSAAKSHLNYIYPYPLDIDNHFPVFFCHPVFTEFIDILDNRKKSKVVGEYEVFIRTDPDIKAKLDACIASIISALLKIEPKRMERDIVKGVVAALQKLFPSDNVVSEVEISAGTANSSSEAIMDAAVFIKDFPFIILEAKNTSYSLNAVLQALQYYGWITLDFIDNDPCFLITFDRGILYVYGVAKVNRRVVCTCLLSLEFTNYFFNVRKFTNTLFKCLGALKFFFDKFSARIPFKSVDSQHIKYSSVKSAPSYDNQPLPAIFSVKKDKNSQESIEISFEASLRETLLKPGVYRVKTQEGISAVLKLASNYNVEVHKILARESLAPKLLGHQVLCNNFHVILMEYFDNFVYDTIFNFFYYRNDSEVKIDQAKLHKSLEGILSKLKQLKIVHGDFRSNNILAKRSETDPSVLEDLKLVDFEFSGFVNKPYPCLATKNPEIVWPDSFNSFSTREYEQDKFMFDQMIETAYKGRIKTKNVEN